MLYVYMPVISIHLFTLLCSLQAELGSDNSLLDVTMMSKVLVSLTAFLSSSLILSLAIVELEMVRVE